MVRVRLVESEGAHKCRLEAGDICTSDEADERQSTKIEEVVAKFAVVEGQLAIRYQLQGNEQLIRKW